MSKAVFCRGRCRTGTSYFDPDDIEDGIDNIERSKEMCAQLGMRTRGACLTLRSSLIIWNLFWIVVLPFGVIAYIFFLSELEVYLSVAFGILLLVGLLCYSVGTLSALSQKLGVENMAEKLAYLLLGCFLITSPIAIVMYLMRNQDSITGLTMFYFIFGFTVIFLAKGYETWHYLDYTKSLHNLAKGPPKLQVIEDTPPSHVQPDNIEEEKTHDPMLQVIEDTPPSHVQPDNTEEEKTPDFEEHPPPPTPPPY